MFSCTVFNICRYLLNVCACVRDMLQENVFVKRLQDVIYNWFIVCVCKSDENLWLISWIMRSNTIFVEISSLILIVCMINEENSW